MHDASERPQSHPRRRDRRDRPGVLLTALGLSALVHVVLFVAFRFGVEIDSAPRSRPVPLVRVVPAMQAYDVVEVAGEAAPIEVQIREQEEIPPDPPRVPPAAPSDPAVEPDPVDPLSVEERLRYRLTTPQVWRAPSEDVAVEPTDRERAEQRIAARLGEFNDSVAAEAERRERSMDWTVKDGDGNRWGVSPGAIHLGAITIPLFDSRFVAAPGRREEFEGRVRTWTEIQIQAARGEAGEEFKDRVKAIEERKAKEREEETKPKATVTSRSGGGKPPDGGR